MTKDLQKFKSLVQAIATEALKEALHVEEERPRSTNGRGRRPRFCCVDMQM